MVRNTISSVSLRREKRYRQKLCESIQVLQALGFAPWAIEYYRREAQRVQKLPHELVCETASGAIRKTIEFNPNRKSRNGAAFSWMSKKSALNGALRVADRRAGSLPALMRRQAFEQSVSLLKTCGLESGAVAHYRRAARTAGVLPHLLVLMAAQFAAWQRLNSDVASPIRQAR